MFFTANFPTLVCFLAWCRLYAFYGQRNVKPYSIPLKFSSLNPNEVLILDKGLLIYVWSGALSKTVKRSKARYICTLQCCLKQNPKRFIKKVILGDSYPKNYRIRILSELPKMSFLKKILLMLFNL